MYRCFFLICLVWLYLVHSQIEHSGITRDKRGYTILKWLNRTILEPSCGIKTVLQNNSPKKKCYSLLQEMVLICLLYVIWASAFSHLQPVFFTHLYCSIIKNEYFIFFLLSVEGKRVTVSLLGRSFPLNLWKMLS